MTPDQEIRAAAIKAASALCAPVSPVDDQQIPNVEDVLFVADVFKGYIEQGWEEALRIHNLGNAQPSDSVRDVELREQKSIEDVHLVEPAPPAESAAPAGPLLPTQGVKEQGETVADIIPIQARGTVTKEQSEARRAVDRVRRQRAEQIVNQARVAKTSEHKQNLLDQTEAAGLLDFPVEVEGGRQELGAFLQSL
ncbi:hypothetical protein ACFW2V_12800 [Streptomyces sp. NPDC058947]|uniref:hypothetical protein n=1 Tax=Streptomyces sp. NPDC058947 TaxID=3346675 RepID=UPI003693DA11